MTTSSDLLTLFDSGQYAAVVEALDTCASGAQQYAWLGISLLRSGQLQQAEGPLHRAAILGSAEGTVEYGNLLRLLGRFEEACEHFEAMEVEDPELKLRRLRWWGVAEFQLGQTEAGLKRVERAWHGYVAYGDDALTARISQSLAQMHLLLGHTARARLLLQEAIRVLPDGPDPHHRLAALKSLMELSLGEGELDEAQRTLKEAQGILRHHRDPRMALMFMAGQAELHRLSGDYQMYAETLTFAAGQADQLGDYNLRIWTTARLADHQSRAGLHGEALHTLLGFGVMPDDLPPELVVTDGVLRRRRGDDQGAGERLAQAAGHYRRTGQVPELIRALLHQAACALRLHQDQGAVALLQEALTQLLRLHQLFEFRADFEELGELLQFAVLDPDLSPLMEPLMDRLSALSGQPRLPEDGAMQLQLTTLGRVCVLRDGGEVKFAYLNTPLLLTYLYLHPNSTLAEMRLALFPEREVKEATGYLRQCIWDLRDKLGSEVIGYEGPHRGPRYRLGRLVRVELDLSQFQQAAGRGELARAVALYRGEFLPGLEESDWLLQRRDEARLTLSFELKNQIARYRMQGDQRRVVLLANQLLKADPLDLEVLEQRVEAARVFAPAPELARYVVALNQLLN